MIVFGKKKYHLISINANFVYSTESWFIRSANWGNTTGSGPLAFNNWNGGVNSNVVSRVVVVGYFYKQGNCL